MRGLIVTTALASIKVQVRDLAMKVVSLDMTNRVTKPDLGRSWILGSLALMKLFF